MSRGSQRGRLACALLKQETTVRAQNVIRIGFDCFFFPKNLLDLLFGLSSIANISKMFENERDRCRKHIAGDLTRPRPKPGEISKNVRKMKGIGVESTLLVI